jgi:hypothetical protein
METADDDDDDDDDGVDGDSADGLLRARVW